MPQAAPEPVPLAEALAVLESLGNEQTRKTYARHGVAEPFWGVKIGDMQPLRKRVKRDYELAKQLWATGNFDAQYFAALVADDERMTKTDLRTWLKTANCRLICEWGLAGVAAQSRHGAALAAEWCERKRGHAPVTGWATWTQLVSVAPDDELDLADLAARLEQVAGVIHDQPDRVRYVMNGFVIAVGSFVAPLHESALAAAEAIGPVAVDMGETACKVPPAAATLAKIAGMGRVGRKRKSTKC